MAQPGHPALRFARPGWHHTPPHREFSNPGSEVVLERCRTPGPGSWIAISPEKNQADRDPIQPRWAVCVASWRTENASLQTSAAIIFPSATAPTPQIAPAQLPSSTSSAAPSRAGRLFTARARSSAESARQAFGKQHGCPARRPASAVRKLHQAIGEVQPCLLPAPLCRRSRC